MTRFAPVILSILALAACSGDGERADTPRAAAPASAASSRAVLELDAPAIAEVGNLCTYRQRKDPVMSGYKDRTGAAWQGELRVRDLPTMQTRWFGTISKVATVVAEPKKKKFSARVDDNCYDAATKTYRACTKVVEADVSAVRGFARAATIEDAHSLAIQLCNRKVKEMVEDTIDLKFESNDLRCEVTEEAFCDLPAAPPAPPPPPAKK